MATVKENTTLREQLISGIFTPQEAKEVLLVLIDKKINFHNNHIFNKWERFGEHCQTSESRLKELRATRQNILKSIADAEEAGLNITLDCKLDINFTKDGRAC